MALWVFLYHFFMPRDLPVLRDGSVGVDCFFILSGFILSHVYAGSFQSFNREELLQFFRARFARIYPVHFAVLIVTIAAVIWIPDAIVARNPGSFSWKTLPAHFLLVNNWGIVRPGWNIPSWSLSTEWLGYLFFPLLMPRVSRWCSGRSGLFNALMAGVCLLPLAAVGIFHGPEYLTWKDRAGLIRFVTEFTAGIFLYQAYVAGFKLRREIAYAVLLLSFGLLVLNVDFRIWGIFGSALLVITCATDEGPVTWLMETDTALWLGEISYSLYMAHWLALQVFGSGLPGLAACSIGTLLLHRYVEVPGRSLGKQWASGSLRRLNSIEVKA